MRQPIHKHVRKHLHKHHRKYSKFLLFFLILLTFGITEDILAIYINQSETFWEVIAVATVLSFIFTIIGEGIEKLYEYEKKHLKI